MLARYVRRNHASNQIIGDKTHGIMKRNKLKATCLLTNFEPRNVRNALDNEIWVEAMNEEIKQIEKNQTWTLLPGPKDKNVIGTKWVLEIS